MWRERVSRPEREHARIAVGLVGGEVYSAPTVKELLDSTVGARRSAADYVQKPMLYFEVVTRVAWEEPYGG